MAAVVLLVAAALIHACQLWSLLANYTVPWFCCTLAIGLVLMVLTSLVTRRTPDTIPPACVTAVVVGYSAAVGLGMLLDFLSYGREMPPDWASSLGEWAGFTGVVAGLFWIARLAKGNTETGAAVEAEGAAPQRQ